MALLCLCSCWTCLGYSLMLQLIKSTRGAVACKSTLIVAGRMGWYWDAKASQVCFSFNITEGLSSCQCRQKLGPWCWISSSSDFMKWFLHTGNCEHQGGPPVFQSMAEESNIGCPRLDSCNSVRFLNLHHLSSDLSINKILNVQQVLDLRAPPRCLCPG